MTCSFEHLETVKTYGKAIIYYILYLQQCSLLFQGYSDTALTPGEAAIVICTAQTRLDRVFSAEEMSAGNLAELLIPAYYLSIKPVFKLFSTLLTSLIN